MRLPTKLERITIEEVSGVDSPANELPGFAVMKSKSKQSRFKLNGEDAALADVLKVVDSHLLIGAINEALVTKGDSMSSDELAKLAHSILELFAILTPEEKQTMLEALDPAVGKSLQNAMLLAQETRNVPTEDDSLAMQAWRRGKR